MDWNALFNAPIANLLILAGLVFLAIAAVGKYSDKIDPGTTGRVVAGVIGSIVFVLGLILLLSPNSIRSQVSTPATTQAAPTIVQAAMQPATIQAAPTVVQEAVQPTSPVSLPTLSPIPPPSVSTPNVLESVIVQEGGVYSIPDGVTRLGGTWPGDKVLCFGTAANPDGEWVHIRLIAISPQRGGEGISEGTEGWIRAVRVKDCYEALKNR